MEEVLIGVSDYAGKRKNKTKNFNETYKNLNVFTHSRRKLFALKKSLKFSLMRENHIQHCSSNGPITWA